MMGIHVNIIVQSCKKAVTIIVILYTIAPTSRMAEEFLNHDAEEESMNRLVVVNDVGRNLMPRKRV